jgi:subtilisin-like proprotein convertase family protein
MKGFKGSRFCLLVLLAASLLFALTACGGGGGGGGGGKGHVASSSTFASTDTGWYTEVGYHDPANRNNLFGLNVGLDYNAFYVFDLTDLDGKATEAILRIEFDANSYSGSLESMEVTIHKVSTNVATLVAGGTGLTDIYSDLETGDSFGTFGVIQADESDILEIRLNAKGLKAINAAKGGLFAIGLNNDSALVDGDWLRPNGGGDYFAELVINPTDIALFLNDSYVQNTPGDYHGEGSNFAATLKSFGANFSNTTGTAAADLISATVGRDFLIIPEQELGNLDAAMGAGDKQALADFVTEGGTLLVSSDTDGYFTNLLNHTFGMSLSYDTSNYLIGGSYSLNTANATGTPFAGGQASLQGNNGDATLTLASLPSNALSIYNSVDQSAVAVIPYGFGRVVVLSWNWYDAKPTGTQDNGWLNVLKRALKYTTASNVYTTNDVPVTIADLSTVTSALFVNGVSSISDVRVTLDLNHTWDSDLALSVISPTGTPISLSYRHGGSSDNYKGTVFDDAAATAVSAGSAPFFGSYIPDGALSTLDTEDANGVWTLQIDDLAGGDVGTLNSWSIQVE